MIPAPPKVQSPKRRIFISLSYRAVFLNAASSVILTVGREGPESPHSHAVILSASFECEGPRRTRARLSPQHLFSQKTSSPEHSPIAFTFNKKTMPPPASHRSRRFSFALLAVLAAFLAAIPAPGQSRARPAPATLAAPTHPQAFEVASVRLEDPNAPAKDTNNPNFQGSPTTFPSNVLIIRHTMLRSLICESYGIDCGNVVGGPDFIDRLHYDLNAKVEGDARLTQEQMQPLMKNLLQERFHLKVHHEQKIVPGYALVIAKGGSKLQPTKGTPSVQFLGGYEFKFQNVSVEYLGKLIGWEIKQPVVDKTGIQGMFDVDLKFAPEDGPLKDDPRFASLPNIFNAVQEQFGLKLVPQKVPVDYLVIDRVDKIPTED